MYSKTLSKSDRNDILNNVRNKAVEKWEAGPLHDEMVELEKSAAKIIEAKQLEIIPQADRDVLDRYGAYEQENDRFIFAQDVDSGNFRAPLYYDKKKDVERVVMRFTDYRVPGRYPDGYPNSNGCIIKLLNSHSPVLLERYHELWMLRKCETDNAVEAFRKLLANCNTSKQVYDVKALRPFMTASLLDYAPPVKADTAPTKTDAAIIAELSGGE